ncbi:MAG: hypothetical protein IIV84_03315, partial [Selenomonadales bacterium]|nr:hypothetical protein [Selenomonadales bacterium]
HDPSIIFFRRDCVDFSCVTLRVAREKSPCRDKKICIERRKRFPTTNLLWGISCFFTQSSL